MKNQMEHPLLRPITYLSDGGLETTMIFLKNMPLRDFAVFELLRSERGREALRDYYMPYLDLASAHGFGFIMESPTWRANADWGYRLGYTTGELLAISKQAIAFMRQATIPYAGMLPDILFSGNIGPRGDGYRPGRRMSAGEAYAYHLEQIRAFALADADMITAATLSYPEEAIGIVQGARKTGIPVVISFTTETDGLLPSGISLDEAIRQVDDATDGYPAYFMINCAHPQHFAHRLSPGSPFLERIRGIRANASTRSHAELDESPVLDPGDRALLASGYLDLRSRLPRLQVIGGCCGTDHTHLEVICNVLPETPQDLDAPPRPGSSSGPSPIEAASVS